MGEMWQPYITAVGMSHGKRQLGKPRLKWVNHNKIDFTEVRAEGVE
jgi:hypothetical protein